MGGYSTQLRIFLYNLNLSIYNLKMFQAMHAVCTLKP